LRHFLTVMETGSFSAAAHALNLTQPALSKSVRSLEAQYKVKLFERIPRGVRPTAFGQRLAYHASLIRAEFENADAEMAALAGGHHGTVRIGAGPTWMRSFLPGAVTRLLHRLPDIEVRILGGLNDTLFASLRRGELDLVVAPLPDDAAAAGEIAHQRLTTLTLRVISSAEHPLQRRGDVRAQELLDYPWILPGADAQLREAINALFRRHGLPAPRPAIVSVSTAFCMSVLREGAFLRFQPARVLQGADGQGIAPLRLAGFAWRRPVGVSYRTGSHLAGPARELMRELTAQCGAPPKLVVAG